MNKFNRKEKILSFYFGNKYAVCLINLINNCKDHLICNSVNSEIFGISGFVIAYVIEKKNE